MPEFIGSDLRGSVFDHVDLSGAVLRAVDLSGARFRVVDLSGAVLRGAELANVEIRGELVNVMVNGVDIAPLVEAELDRRYPDRPRMRPASPAGFAGAWDRDRMATVRRVIEGLTDESLAARTKPVEPGSWPPPQSFPVRECLLTVLNEEWEHRLYAERDLAILEERGAR